jgi:sRNA-binding regulator protein Hfq
MYVLIEQLNRFLVSLDGHEKLGELSLKNKLSLKNNQDIFHVVLKNNLEFINDLEKYDNYVVKLSDEISSLLVYRNSGLIPREPYTHNALELNICILTRPLFSYTRRNTFGDPYGHINNTKMISIAVSGLCRQYDIGRFPFLNHTINLVLTSDNTPREDLGEDVFDFMLLK